DISSLISKKEDTSKSKEKTAENKQNAIIGNTPYRYIPEKTYRKLDKDIALKVAEQIEKAGLKYSGKINEDTVTLTVSKKDIEQIDKLIADIKGTSKEQATQRHFSEEEIETAKRTDLVDYLMYRGEQLKKVGNDEYTMPQHDSMRISSQKGYYWNSRNVGGNALNFCIDYYGMDFKTAVTELLNFNGRSIENIQNNISMPQEKPKAEHKPLPYDISEDTSKVFEYLTKTRMLDENIVKTLIESGSIAQDVKGNAVYKIFDENSKLSGAEISGTSGERYKQYTEQNGGGFTVQPNKDKEPSKLMFFESAVDLLSFYSFAKMNNKNIDDFRLISMGGLKDKVIETAISRYEEKNGVKPSFFISDDNDEAGHKFNQKYPNNVYDITSTSIFKELGDSKIKDWNELLQAVTEKEKTQSISYLPDDSVEYSKFIFDEGIRDKNLRLIYKNSADTYMMNFISKDDIKKANDTAKKGNEFFKLLIDSSVKNEVEEGTFYYMGADNAYGRDNHIFSGLNAETMNGLVDFADNDILNIPEKEVNNSGEIPSKEEMTTYLLWLGSNKRMSKRNILEGFSHLDTIEEKAEFIKREYTIKGLNDESESMKFSIGDKKYEWTWAELAASAEKMIAEHNYLTNKDIEKLGLITVDEVKEITKKAEDVKKYIAEINKAVTNEKSYIPLYTNSAEYARENGEIDDYRASNRENERCNKYISENYGEYHNASSYIFDRDSFADNIISEFGLERATAVIAGYINENDGRYTRECKAEANKYKLPKQYYTNMHPTLINSLFERFIDLNREKTKEMSQEPINQTIDNSDKYKSLLTIDEEKAIEIFTKSDLPIYLIYDDNTNAIAHSEEEIENHSGTFGISKDDFEKYNSEAEKISETEDISDNTDVKEETKKEAKEEVKKSEAKQKESTTNEELINGIPKEIILAALKTGTGFVDGKFRVEK
ncbi:MAG: DUF3849 domain-containing protein, partial [Firmicutes bacterium]|nr:DUF3849 domain-containing protein [Bacillota bacterium]